MRWDGTAVAAGRIGMGVVGLVAPTRAQQVSLLAQDADTTVEVWTRFWATRAIGLGVGYLAAGAETRRHLIRIGLLVDGLDTAFLLAMSTRRDAPRRALLWLAALTAWATAGDIAEIRSQGESTHHGRSQHQRLRPEEQLTG